MAPSKPPPPIPRPQPRWLTVLCGILHTWVLVHIGLFWQRIRQSPDFLYGRGVIPLPFNLYLKTGTNGTREEECLAMQVAYSMGLPVPKFISYGEDPFSEHLGNSILMTQMPGKNLAHVWVDLSEDQISSIMSQLAEYLAVMRSFQNPWGDRICGASGKNYIRGQRLPRGRAGPCASEKEFYDFLLSYTFIMNKEMESFIPQANGMYELMPHQILFTHGDLWLHNILVEGGRITGIVDWEYAGWMPEYWEYTTIIRRPFAPWWSERLKEIPEAAKYDQEGDCDYALFCITDTSFLY